VTHGVDIADAFTDPNLMGNDYCAGSATWANWLAIL
jgi:hypothetical protein